MSNKEYSKEEQMQAIEDAAKAIAKVSIELNVPLADLKAFLFAKALGALNNMLNNGY
jgi:signal transduction histidine kinase